MGYRTDLRAALVSTLQTFATANPTELIRVYTARPEALNELPCAYVDSINAVVAYFPGVRQQHLVATVTLADKVPDGPEAEARMDVLADALLDTFTAAYHMVDGYSITQATGYTERLVQDATVPYLGLDYVIDLDIGQGRT